MLDSLETLHYRYTKGVLDITRRREKRMLEVIQDSEEEIQEYLYEQAMKHGIKHGEQNMTDFENMKTIAMRAVENAKEE